MARVGIVSVAVVSVCPQPAWRLVSKRRKLASWFLHHPSAWTFTFLELSGSTRNSIGVTPSEGDFWDWGGYELAILAIFRPINHRISETVQDMTTVARLLYWSLIGNRIRAFDWYQKQRHWMTLNWPWTAIMCSVALHTSFGDHQKWMKIDRYYQRQKCSPGIAVSSKIRLMPIFAGVRWRGASNESGVVENGNFRLFYQLYFPNLHI